MRPARRRAQNLRSALSAELGIDPSPALRRLEAMVLAQDPALQPPEVSPPSSRHLLPAALDIGERFPLAGRGLELQVLATAWAAACAGRSATALVSGDAGIGKSRLLRECARSAQSEEGIVLYGRCDPELAIACQPFVECLSEAVAASPDRVLADIGERKLAELARMVPELASRRPDLPPRQGRTLTWSATCCSVRRDRCFPCWPDRLRCWLFSTICTGRTGRPCSC